MIQSGVGISTNTDAPRDAGLEAAKLAAEKAGGKPDVFIVLSSIAMRHPEVLSGIEEAYPGVPMVGCSTSGEITSDGPSKESVVAMALRSDQMQFTVGIGQPVKGNEREAGRALANDIKSRAPLEVTSMIIFSDVLGANGTEISRGVLDVFGENFLMVGGAAGDDLNFKDTHEYYNGKVLSGHTVGVGLSGKYKKAFGAKHGWESVGATKKVTKATGTTVYEIDGKPAFETYKEYLGDKADDIKKGILNQIALTYPLGMRVDKIDGYMIRVPLVFNDDGSIVFGAEVIVGSTVNIMIGTQEKSIEAAVDVAKNVAAEFKDGAPKALFISDCIARKKLYGPNVAKEITEVTNIIGPQVPLVGFYSYGQHAPVYGVKGNIDACDPGFYEESIVIFAIGE
ncbi:FIST C-terminal domain-containing protein [Candidatus Microgenomates bacterium]|nr:FIST C-terminal domain-containing protein [Candidatus Microgenomates bacterium]